MTKNTSSGAKKHCECIKPESCQTAKLLFFFSSPDGLVQIMRLFIDGFCTKKSTLYTDQFTSPLLFHNFDGSDQ